MQHGQPEGLQGGHHKSSTAAAVGKAASHAGQATLSLTPMQDKVDFLKPLIAKFRAALPYAKAATEQFRLTDPWAALLH